MNKELIKKRFSDSLNTYENNANIQKKMAIKLFSFLDKYEYENILEIGCGTGFLTEIANKNLSYNNYTAVDIVDECENYIKKINKKIDFQSEDIEEFLNHDKKKYDLIISNASLQWINDFEGLIKKLVNRLSKNGTLLFSTFGTENYREISFIIGEKLNYLSISHLKKLLENYNPKIEEEIHIMSFSCPKDVLKHFRYTGVNAMQTRTWTKKDLIEFENYYNNLCSNHPTLTYNPIYIKFST